MEPSRNDTILRFGAFELDRHARELRKHGLRIHLQEQPLAILEMLLERAGEIVNRHELRERLWSRDTFVDFERGLNAGVTRLRQALGDSADQPRYLETVPRRGYRFIASVAESQRPGSRPDSSSGDDRMVTAATPGGRGPVAYRREARGHGLVRLIVLPFRQLQPDKDLGFLCFSLADAISSSLAGLESMVVRSSRVASRFAVPMIDLRTIAAEADVETVMTGTLLRSGTQLRVSAQLLQVPEGTVLWTHTAQVALGEIFWLQDELTRRIIESLIPSLTERDRRLLRRDVPASARAYEFYLRANHLSAQMRDLTLARDLYRCCLEEDPQYAPAWARIARCYRILAKYQADPSGNNERAEEAFQRAFALDPDLPALHSLYAYHETDQGHAKEAVCRLLSRLESNCNDPELYAGLVYACRYAGLLEASLAAHELALRTDPNARTSIMNTYFAMGEYKLALGASTDDVGYMEAMALDALNRRQEALDRVRRCDHLPPLISQLMKTLELYLEDRGEEAVERLLELNRRGVDPEGFFYRARILARLKKTEEALITLEQALRAGFYCVPAWLEDSYLEPIRGTERYRDLLHQAGVLSMEAKTAFVQAGGEHFLGIVSSAKV